MRHTTADQSLGEEQKGGNAHELEGRALGVAYRQSRRAGRYRRAPVPAEIVEFSEGEKHGRRPAEQEDDTERAVEKRPSSRSISGQRLVREVVGIGMRSAGACGCRGPSRPCEER